MPFKKSLALAFEEISGKKGTLFLFLTLIAGAYILWPLHNFQNYLSQGDHGRDLYCFKLAMEGAIPYRDFSWLFGPLMPYYYSLFYFFGGVNIQSVLIGYGLLVLLTGVFIYLACSVFLSPALSFTCAIWYWGFRGVEFFYTYNHSGGLIAIVATLYFCFRYIRDNRLAHVYAGFICVIVLALIRLNMGVAVLISFALSLFLTDLIHKDQQASQKRKLYVCLSLSALGIILFIYWLLLHPLPEYAIAQSFPYGKAQRVDQTGSVLSALIYGWSLIRSYFSATLPQVIFGTILCLAAIQSILLISSKNLPIIQKRDLILIFSTLAIFIVFTSHEFVASGIFYRLCWFFPLIYVTIFFLIGTATKGISSSVIKGLIILTFLIPSIFNIQREHSIIRLIKKNPLFLLDIGENKIYTSQDPLWFQTVHQATAYLKENVPPSDTILVLPLDPLYLFLSGRDSATRQLVFFEHINIPPAQEKAIISDLESNSGNWVLLSSRSATLEAGMGTFGKTYCPLLSKYIDDHYAEVAKFGDWVNPPGWAWNHGVKVLKRKR